jgi:hypothetical protein
MRVVWIELPKPRINADCLLNRHYREYEGNIEHTGGEEVEE